MKFVMFWLTALCLMVGCSKTLQWFEDPHSEHTITFGVDAGGELQTRSTVLLGAYESKIWNYNLYCVHSSTGMVRHEYVANKVQHL